jgi:hypothetical protein
MEVEKEWQKTIDEVKALYLREMLKELSNKMTKLEKEGKEEEMKVMQREFGKLSKRLAELP